MVESRALNGKSASTDTNRTRSLQRFNCCSGRNNLRLWYVSTVSSRVSLGTDTRPKFLIEVDLFQYEDLYRIRYIHCNHNADHEAGYCNPSTNGKLPHVEGECTDYPIGWS